MGLRLFDICGTPCVERILIQGKIRVYVVESVEEEGYRDGSIV
jgi:hypothetical protein